MLKTPATEPLEPTPASADLTAGSHRPARRRSLLLLLFGGLGGLALLGRVIQLSIQEVYPALRRADFSSQTLPAAVVEACAMLFCILLLLPILATSWQALKGRPLRRAAIPPIRVWQVILLLAAWFSVLVSATGLVYVASFGWVLALPFFLLGITLPVAGLAWIGIGGLPGGSWRRLWAALGLGMLGGSGLALAVEYMLFAGIGLLATRLLPGNLDLDTILEQVKLQMQTATAGEEMIAILAPYLHNPLILIGILILFAGLGPLIEELCKPLAVLLTGRRLHSPAEGFALGALGGAGFALLEGLVSISGFVELAGVGLLMRAAASLMHILASGLVGWGYASLLLRRDYGRMLGMLLLAVGLHGLWNGSIVISLYGAVLFSAEPTNLLPGLAMLAGLGTLMVIFALTLIFLPLLNYQLRRQGQAELRARLPAN
jgi:hypothetical protein